MAIIIERGKKYMMEVSEERFEQIIKEMLNENKTKTQVKTELGVSFRTFNKMVEKLSISSPDLYLEYIEKYPYEPKGRRDIDIIRIGLEFIQGKGDIDELARKYGTARKTIQRHINRIKDSEIPEEQELYYLFKAVAENHSKAKQNSSELQLRIDKLEEKLEFLLGKDKGKSNLEIRASELKEGIKEFEKLSKKMSKTAAAKQMGTTREVMHKQMQELKNIETEIRARKKNFKSSLHVETKPVKQENVEQKKTMDKQEREH